MLVASLVAPFGDTFESVNIELALKGRKLCLAKPAFEDQVKMHCCENEYIEKQSTEQRELTAEELFLRDEACRVRQKSAPEVATTLCYSVHLFPFHLANNEVSRGSWS